MNFRADFSLGNILTILAMIVSVALAYGQVASAIEHQDRRLTKVEELVSLIKTDQTSATKLRGDDRLEVTRVLVELQTELRYIRAQIEALNRATNTTSAPPVLVPARPTTR